MALYIAVETNIRTRGRAWTRARNHGSGLRAARTRGRIRAGAKISRARKLNSFKGSHLVSWFPLASLSPHGCRISVISFIRSLLLSTVFGSFSKLVQLNNLATSKKGVAPELWRYVALVVGTQPLGSHASRHFERFVARISVPAKG